MGTGRGPRPWAVVFRGAPPLVGRPAAALPPPPNARPPSPRARGAADAQALARRVRVMLFKAILRQVGGGGLRGRAVAAAQTCRLRCSRALEPPSRLLVLCRASGLAHNPHGLKSANPRRPSTLKQKNPEPLPAPQDVGWFDRDDNSSGRLTTLLATDASYIRGAVGDVFGEAGRPPLRAFPCASV
jgi:hypothetical protein